MASNTDQHVDGFHLDWPDQAGVVPNWAPRPENPESFEDLLLDWPDRAAVTNPDGSPRFSLNWPEPSPDDAGEAGEAREAEVLSPTPPPEPEPEPEPLPAAHTSTSRPENPESFAAAVIAVAHGDLPAVAATPDHWAIQYDDVTETFSADTWYRVHAIWDQADKPARTRLFDIIDRYESLWWERHGSFPATNTESAA